MVGTLDYIKSLNDAGVISPGIFAKKEQDKVEEFVNGRVGMMVDSLAHINLIRERNPDLNFGIIRAAGGRRLQRQARPALCLLGHRHQRGQRDTRRKPGSSSNT